MIQLFQKSVSEIRRVREENAASFAYDVGKIVADFQSRQGKDGRRVVDGTSRKKPEQSGQHELSTAALP